MSTFYQIGQEFKNPWQEDIFLQDFLGWKVGKNKNIIDDMKRFGQRLQQEVEALGRQAEGQPPQLVSFSPWGKRIDEIQVSEAWKKLDQISAEEGLVAIGYEREFGALSRVYQWAKLYMFHPSSAFYSCPLAMTDGAARVLEQFVDKKLKDTAFNSLTSRNPEQFWTSGQWMTEREGGSDVSNTATRAQADGEFYKLYGAKWFSSATTSQMALALARVDQDPALSLFYIPVRNDNGELNNIEILRLKDKLGTKALPTAEIKLVGTRAQLIGERGQGVKNISSMLNITRLYNSICAVGEMRRSLSLAQDYASKRKAFGAFIAEQPLHQQTLLTLTAEVNANLSLTLDIVYRLGLFECNEATEQDILLLRLLTPVTKLMTAKSSVKVVSECLECFGGAGYIEDTGLPRHLRDAQVFPIWEGTTNVLSLDVLRVLSKQPEAFEAYTERVTELVSGEGISAEVRDRVILLTKNLDQFIKMQMQNNNIQAGARLLAFQLGQLYAGAVLLSFGQELKKTNYSQMGRWYLNQLSPLEDSKMLFI